jgi:hypothetical protein
MFGYCLAARVSSSNHKNGVVAGDGTNDIGTVAAVDR